MKFKLGSVYSKADNSSNHGKKILKFLNENAVRGVNNHSLLNYAMVIDEPDFEQEESDEEYEGGQMDFYMNLNSQKKPQFIQNKMDKVYADKYAPAPFMNPS